eukprot:m.46576 g.46576  ORF g.46576 m.46576 type:complete len:285 (+) comp13157_c0_seq9:115-969(+)
MERMKEQRLVEPVAPSETEHVDAKLIQVRAESFRKQSHWLQYRPYLHPGLDLDQVVDLMMGYEDDFCWSSTQHPEYYARLIRAGFLCIASTVGRRHVLVPKLHVDRCLMTDLNNLVVSKGTRKKAKRYQMTINTAFDDVAEGCIDQHGYNWLGMVLGSLKQLHEHPQHGVKVHSIEVWRENQLVAGELGTTVGSVYTSLTGFTRESGSGSVQLVTLCRLLQQQGFTLWDLGMGMSYKLALGATDEPRARYISLLRAKRDDADIHLRQDGRRSCRSILDGSPSSS